MKINLKDLKEMDSFIFKIKGIEINVNINNDDILDVSVHVPTEIVNKDINEKTKTWFNTILTKADEYDAKKRLKIKENQTNPTTNEENTNNE